MLDLNSVMIGSEDAKALAQFYKTVLGEPQMEDQGFSGWQVGSGWLMIMPHSEVKGRNETPGRIILNFETPEFDDEFKRIKGLGASVKQDPYQPEGASGMWIATFEDPDGNYFQIASPMPQE